MKWLVAVVAVEAITEILLESELFEWLRTWAQKYRLPGILLTCGWCLSVWVGAFAFALVWLGLWPALVPFAIARASNYLHDLYGRVRG